MARVVVFILVIALAATAVTTSAAQEPATALPSSPVPTIPTTPSAMVPRNMTCVSTLLGCMVYYQNTTVEPEDPLDMCCEPARRVHDGDLDCLCDGIANPTLVDAVDLDVKKGMSLFSRCGVKVPDDVCSSRAGNPTPKSGSDAAHEAQFSSSRFLVLLLFALWPLLP